MLQRSYRSILLIRDCVLSSLIGLAVCDMFVMIEYIPFTWHTYLANEGTFRNENAVTEQFKNRYNT